MHDTLRSYYSKRASEYDRVYEKPERQNEIAGLRNWLPKQFCNATLLDIACGTGYWTQHIAPATHLTIGVDTSRETLDIARHRVTTGRAQFVRGDVYHLPFRRRFNAVFVGFWFSHVPKPRRRAFLNNLAVVLTDGAKIIVLDNRYVTGSSTPISTTDEEGNTYQTRKLDDGSQHLILKNFPSPGELEDLILDLGCEPRVEHSEHFWTLSYTHRESSSTDFC